MTCLFVICYVVFSSFQWAYPGHPVDVRNHVHYGKAFGLAVGVAIGSFFSDYLGRRRVIYVSFLLLCSSQCVTGISEDPGYFLACQAIVGLGAGRWHVRTLVVLYIIIIIIIHHHKYRNHHPYYPSAAAAPPPQSS